MKRAKKKNSNPLRWWKFIGGLYPPGGNKDSAIVDQASEATVFDNEQLLWDAVSDHAVDPAQVEVENVSY